LAIVALPDYAELHCASNFSFLRGASHPAELVERAAALGYKALAITDECSLAGVVRAHVAAKQHKLQLLIGAEFRLEGGPRIVLLATDAGAYGNLSQLITLARSRSDKGQYRLEWDDLGAVGGCLSIMLPAPESGSDAAELAHARRLRDCFADRAWLAVELLCGPDDCGRLQQLRELSAASKLPLVAAGDVHMHLRSRRPLQDTLTAIRLGTPVAEAQHALFPNAERHLRMRVRLAQIYAPELLAETLRVAELCEFSLDSIKYEYPAELVPAGHTPASYLRLLTEEGLRRRYPEGAQDGVRRQVEEELALIVELRYEAYFLTVHDIVSFARGRDILCQGRGSAANSAVCYALGITAIDPARSNLLFGRFISRERNEPPDIDVDFEHQRREEVIQYLYAKYGRDRAALTATVITYGTRSAVRDVGRALGFDLAQVERMGKALAWWDSRDDLPRRLGAAGFDPDSPRLRQLVALISALIDFPRHLSQHTGGFVFAPGSLSRMVPIENAAMPGRSVIQWNKDDLDALGLLKVDVLALGMLSALKRAFDMIGQRRGKRFGMTDIPDGDAAVYRMMQQADTIGVFQIESRAQMSMLPRLKPQEFYDLVIQIAIVRPGPIQGGMVHPYLQRRQHPELVEYPSPAVEAVLRRTLGVPIFQEQVMELAVVAAGFTPGEADQLRRSMAAWRRKGGLEHLEQRLISGMLKNGYPQEFAKQIYQQILGFGEYGFPESHSASFALLAYASAWIKHYEPAVFLAALLNSQPMGFYRPSQLVQDARRHGVEVRAVDVTVSDWDCTLEYPAAYGTDSVAPAVRLGLCMIKAFTAGAATRLLAARALLAFESVAELARRAALNRQEMSALAAAGALAALAGHRRHAHWQAAGIERATRLLAAAPPREEPPAFAAPSEGEELVADHLSTGLTLGRHPLALLRRRLLRMRFATAADLRNTPHGRQVRVAGIVTGRQRPGTASGTTFVTLEDETGSVNVVVWRDVGERQRRELLGAHLLGVQGILERNGEVVHLIAGRLTDHSELLGGLLTPSRDFH
jgi:error-prone DNA polymerase